MDKNSVIGFVLIAVIFIGFTVFQSNQARKRMEAQAQLDSISRVEMLERQLAEAAQVAAQPDSAAAAEVVSPVAIYKDSLLESASRAQEEIITLENSKIKVEFTTRGAQPYAVQVKDYKNYDSTDLYIFKPGKAQYSLSLYAGEAIRTQDFIFQVAERTDSTVVMRLPFAGGGYIEQKYTLHPDSYQMDNLISFVDHSAPAGKF